MNLEKRGGQAPAPVEDSAKPPSTDEKKPVILYILIMFVVAFLLMALSLLMHQRSNTEALGQLNESIAATKDLQNAQEQIEELEQELKECQAALTESYERAAQINDAANNIEYRLERTQEAMDRFWQLDEAYVLEDAEQCADILARMNGNAESPDSEYLSPQAAERYAEIITAPQES